MAFRFVGTKPIVISTAFAIKSTGLPLTNSTQAGKPKWWPLNGSFARIGMYVSLASTVATSGFTLTLKGAVTTANPGNTASSKYVTLVQMTSANLGSMKMSTVLIPVTHVFLRSTKFTTAAGRSVRIAICAVPS